MGWFVSGMTTAAGVAVEYGTSSNANWGYSSKKLRLKGYSVQSPSSLAASTVMGNLRIGESSALISSTPIFLDTPEFVLSVSGLDLRANYFAITAGTTHASGLIATMWGDRV
jgi:hypothetical protein